MATELPLCRYCKQPYQLMRETSEFWEMACESCKVGHVFSKPRSQAAGLYRAQLQQRLETERRIKQWESRPKYFLPTRTSKGVD